MLAPVIIGDRRKVSLKTKELLWLGTMFLTNGRSAFFLLLFAVDALKMGAQIELRREPACIRYHDESHVGYVKSIVDESDGSLTEK